MLRILKISLQLFRIFQLDETAALKKLHHYRCGDGTLLYLGQERLSQACHAACKIPQKLESVEGCDSVTANEMMKEPQK